MKNEDRKLIVALIVGLLAVFLVWLLVPLALSTYLPLGLSSDELEEFTAIATLFGAPASLFTGLGLVGLAIVLLFDIRERRRDLDHRKLDQRDRKHARRPFVLPHVDPSSGVQVQRASASEVTAEVVLKCRVDLRNASDESALNLRFSSTAHAGDALAEGVAIYSGIPLGALDTEELTLEFRFSGPPARAVLRSFDVGGSVIVDLEIRHTGLNGVVWKSEVQYALDCTREPDRTLFRHIIDPAKTESIAAVDGQVVGGSVVFLNARPVNDSWEHNPA